MKILTITILVLISSSLFAQKKCKYGYEKVDPMTEEVVRYNYIEASDYNVIAISRTGDSLLIHHTIVLGGQRNTKVGPGAELKLKLNDNSFLIFKSIETALPTVHVFTGAVGTKYSIQYPCTKEDLEKIASSGFAVFSYSLDNNPVSVELPKKVASKTQDYARCILLED